MTEAERISAITADLKSVLASLTILNDMNPDKSGKGSYTSAIDKIAEQIKALENRRAQLQGPSQNIG